MTTKRIPVREDIHSALKAFCLANNRCMSEVLEDALFVYLSEAKPTQRLDPNSFEEHCNANCHFDH